MPRRYGCGDVVVVNAGKIPSIVYCFDNAFGCTLLFVLVSRVLRAIVGVIDNGFVST